MSWNVTLKTQRPVLDIELVGALETVCLIGPNGAGKSTLLRQIVSTHPESVGRIDLDGDVFFDSSVQLNVPVALRRVGYLPQNLGLFEHLRVVDNVAFGVNAAKKSERRAIAMEVLADFSITELADKRPTTLSGGQRQRVALARLVAGAPQLLLLDEPFAAMDIVARQDVYKILLTYVEHHKIPSIIVTHDVRDIIALGASVAVMESGKIVQTGTPEQLSVSPCSAFVDAFFMGYKP